MDALLGHLNEACDRLFAGAYVIVKRGTQRNPMCINCFCPSAHDCSRFICDPVTDRKQRATIVIDPRPAADGRCPEFVALLRDSDGSGEAGETRAAGLDPKDDSAGRDGIAQDPPGRG